MKLLKNILVAVDFSEPSDRAIDVSIQLAKVFNSSISIIHVSSDETLTKETEKKIEIYTYNRISEIKVKIFKENLDIPEVIIEKGIAFEKIIQVAQKKNVNVIIVGSGSKSHDDKFKLGTTVEKLMRKNQIPLWVVKNEPVKPIKSILCPVDFSSSSKRALQNAITLARSFNANLSIIHIFTPYVGSSIRLGSRINAQNENLYKERKAVFSDFLAHFNLKSIAYTKELLKGNPNVEIIKTIEKQQTDLLLMGTTGKTGISRLLMGSTTEKVTRELPCSLVTTKEQDITDDFLESYLQGVESILIPAKELLKKGKYNEAIDKYLMGLRQYPDNVPIINGLISSYTSIENQQKVKFYTAYKNEILKRYWDK